MTIEELLIKLRDVQDALDELEPMDENGIEDLRDLIHRLIQDVEPLEDGHAKEPWIVSE
jgi:hypothetical protein|tara:strand:+ start:2164 stop:2340 length:177 start_codon:yes stop_codon:yes gene_type:complete